MKQTFAALLSALALSVALNSQFSTALAQGSAFTTLAIPSPTPAIAESFGISMAGMGPDRFVVGSWYDTLTGFRSGAAYLYNTNGALLATFTNPVPQNNDYFGFSVATVGDDQVLVGAGGFKAVVGNPRGAAFLFSTNGALLTTITNPVPDFTSFGYSVAAVGSGRVLIGAPLVDLSGGVNNVGATYLFSTSGTSMTTFTNPTPALDDNFGHCVAAVGTDLIVIAAPYDNTGASDAGAVYLYSTNGSLLTTLTNPTPQGSDRFGISVAAVGSDQLLIGAEGDRAGGLASGAAYLFRTNGALLVTFTNPAPAIGDYFGDYVAAVGTERVIIGAYGDDGTVGDEGVAYLFSTNGSLIMTFTNPAPVLGDLFGFPVGSVGNDLVLIGAYLANRSVTDEGAVYLYFPVRNSEASVLNVCLTTTNTVAISWSSDSAAWQLQQNTNSVSSVTWSNVTSGIQVSGSTKTLIVDPPSGIRFYRLISP